MALTCLRKYKLIVIDKIASESAESGDLHFGTALHTAVNSVLEGSPGEEVFLIHWDSVKDKDLAYSRFKWPELRNIGLTFVRKFTQKYYKKFTPVIMEERLYSEYKGIKFEGTLDFAGDFEGIPTVADWKTTAYSYDKDKAAISFQLYLYAYLAFKERGFLPQQLMYLPFVKSSASIQTPVIVPFAESNMYSVLDEMVSYISVLSNVNNVFPKNLNACFIGASRCNMYSVCHGAGRPDDGND